MDDRTSRLSAIIGGGAGEAGRTDAISGAAELRETAESGLSPMDACETSVRNVRAVDACETRARASASVEPSATGSSFMRKLSAGSVGAAENVTGTAAAVASRQARHASSSVRNRCP